jgi:hypothetical protein
MIDKGITGLLKRGIMKTKTPRIQLDWKKLLAFSMVKFVPGVESQTPGNPAKAMIGGKGTSPGTVSYLPFYLMMEMNKRQFCLKFVAA